MTDTNILSKWDLFPDYLQFKSRGSNISFYHTIIKITIY